jgi:GAF domain-containing protein
VAEGSCKSRLWAVKGPALIGGVLMSREATLIRTLVEIADNLVDDFDVIDVLTVLSHRCVEVIDVHSAGVMLVTPAGELQVIASSSEAMRILELFELQSDEGPCLECFRSGNSVVNMELSKVHDRWPQFAQRAIGGGFFSVHALPMRSRGVTVGALNMFRVTPGPLSAEDIAVAQALADVATIAIIQYQSSIGAAELIAQLNEALNSRIIIEQAKGKVSESSGLDMPASFQMLRNHARSHNLHLTDLARSIADGTMSCALLDPVAAG